MLIPPYTPELISSAQDFLTSYIRDRSEREVPPLVLEYGSGWSTVWFAETGAEVVSFEHDFAWWLNVSRTLELLGNNSVLLHLLEPRRFETATHYLPFNSFDVAYIDCYDRVRVECARAALTRVKVGGLLVLDDTHWDLWTPLLQTFDEPKSKYKLLQRFKGDHLRKTGETKYHQTDVYRKEG